MLKASTNKPLTDAQRSLSDLGIPEAGKVAAYASLTNSLLSEFGPLPQFYRASTSGARPYVKDCNGNYKLTNYGECLFYGARRVENLLSDSCNFSTANWTVTLSATVTPVYDSNHPGPRNIQNAFLLTRSTSAFSILRRNSGITYRAVPHTFSIWMKSGTHTQAEIRIHISGGATLATKIVTLTSSWQRFSVTGTPDGTSSYVVGVTADTYVSTTAGTIYIADAMMEEKIDGTTAPSEYVSRGEIPISRFYHGAGVDAVKYFSTTLANTVDANGLVTEATGTPLTNVMGAMTFASAIQQITDNNVSSGWGTTNVTLTDNAATAPDGSNTAISIDEGTGAGVVHHIQRTLTGLGGTIVTAADSGSTWYCFQGLFKKGASGATWMRLFIQDTASTGKSAYFDLDNGVAGTVTSGTLNIHSAANGWYHVMWSVPFYEGSGSSDPILRISMAGGDNTPTYTGTSRVNYMWLPCMHISTSTTGPAANRPIASPISSTGASVSTLAGQGIAFSVRGLLGYTNFGAVSTYYPYYQIEQVGKKQYTGTTYIRTESLSETRGSTPANLDIQRTGVTIRPPLSGGAANAKFAFDFYNGDPNTEYFWQPNTPYEVGDYVIPTDTQPNNDNARKVFTCVQAGTSGGSEPTWNTTFTSPPDTVSNLTTDNTVRWQVNVDNGINGRYEPYSGSELLGDQGFLGEYKIGWYVAHDDYQMYINGVECHRQTTPRPTFVSKGYTLDYKPKTLFLGTFGSNSGQYPEAVPSGQEDAVMPVHCAIHRDVIIYHTAPSGNSLLSYTA